MSDGRSLYEEDFVLWSEQQAAAIRAVAASGANLPLDWENLAEEIESLGRSQRTEARSRLSTILEHLLKLEFSPASEPRRGWIDTVERERRNLEFLLLDSPSLRGQLRELADHAAPYAVRSALRSLARHREAAAGIDGLMERRCYSVEEILGPWLPDEQPPRSPH